MPLEIRLLHPVNLFDVCKEIVAGRASSLVDVIHCHTDRQRHLSVNLGTICHIRHVVPVPSSEDGSDVHLVGYVSNVAIVMSVREEYQRVRVYFWTNASVRL